MTLRLVPIFFKRFVAHSGMIDYMKVKIPCLPPLSNYSIDF